MTCTVLLAVITIGSCNGLAGDDEMDRYFQRSDTITLSAGNAKEVNAVTHTIHPWPPGVGDRRIVANGQRMVGAVRRYQTTQRPLDTLPNIGEGSIAMGQPPPQQIDVNNTGGGSVGVQVPIGPGGR